MSRRNFPDFIQGFLDYTAKHEAPELYKKWAAMSMVAGALERKVWCSNGFVTLYPNLYVFLVGDRGVGKSVMSNIAVSLLEELPDMAVAANKINDASLVKKLINTGNAKKFEYNSHTYKSSSVFLYASEAASTFKEMYPGSSILTTLTDLYNCNDSPWSLIPKWKKDTIKEGEIAVHNPCINMLACSTPTWLMSKVMTKSDIEGGFGSRCVMVVHKGDFTFKEGWKQGSLEEVKLREKVLEDLKRISEMKGVFFVEDSWIELHKKYTAEHKERMTLLSYSDPMLGSCLARKASTFLMKVSMVLAASEGTEMVLHARHAERAWAMLTELEETMAYAFGSYAEAHEVKHTEDIKRYIVATKQPCVSFSHVVTMFKKQYASRKIRDAFNELRQQGFLTPQFEKGPDWFLVNSDGEGPGRLTLVQTAELDRHAQE